MPESSTPEDVRLIHDTILALDAHLDLEATFFMPEQPEVSGWQKLASLDKIQEGGLGAAFFVAYTDQGPLTGEGYARAYETVVGKIDTIRRVLHGPLQGKIGLALHPGDVHAVHDSGRIAAAIALENGYALGEDLGRLRHVFSLGVRYITLSQVGHNQICDSKWSPGQPEPLHGGLSPFGKQVVATMNELGCMIDVAHISKPSVLDVFGLSKSPVLVSHSGAQGVGGVGNILDDEELDGLGDNGGVIHLVGLRRAIKTDCMEKTQEIADLRVEFGLPVDFWPFFLALQERDVETRMAYEARLEIIEENHGRPNVRDLVDHVDYVVNRIGIDHVGLSSDFYNYSFSLDGWRDASETRNVTRELVRRGYTVDEIGKIWSGNVLRVWSEVEEVAAQLQR
ncbi:MAG: membrane dipeptidase [Anaerolineae bacterium]|jgi:microsomal dipeptidase-like Zn-dependent dipeptidase